MAENDEVHEDLQVVAMTAGAAAARTAETLIRARTSQQSDRDTRQRQGDQNSSPARHRDPELVKARQVADAQDPSRPRASITDPDTWTVTGDNPVTKRQQWTLNQRGIRTENMPTTKADASRMITALHDGQSPRDIRVARDAADAMNGRPATAAARWESINKAVQQNPAPRIQQRDTGRSR